jgi:hypothetical protein
MPRTKVLATLLASACLVTPACLRRPVSDQPPTTKDTYGTMVPQPAIDKIDILVMVDNSGSMADKQKLLGKAVPDLVRGLVLPKCVDKKTRAPTGKLSDPTKPDDEMCEPGSEPAFPPVTDMHLGVISSSLGGFGSAECAKDFGNDHGHLLARTEVGDAVSEAGDLHFLAWYPDVEKNRDKQRHPDPPVPKIADENTLSNTFSQLILGVGQGGCGLEAQLESIYHFLIQPDPWVSIDRSGDVANYGPSDRIDRELLRQRAAFLRPDSLLAIIVLTDEDDSSPDPLALGGQGWLFEQSAPFARSTPVCATDPNSTECTSCRMTPRPPGCPSSIEYSETEDNGNVRFHDMKRRFGVDPQFPIQRYVDAFTKPRVPRRDKEHDANGNYVPKPACTNPLFAARLPVDDGDELCDLPRGPRIPGLIYFALIGGVPQTLLPEKGEIDWTKILGRSPETWDDTGIDPHMIQSIRPRKGLAPPSSADTADPVHGREWDTQGRDLQYACTFRLPEAVEAVPGKTGDCDPKDPNRTPLCDPADPKMQIRAKAYPTRRELMVTKGLSEQGIVASLCPKQIDDEEKDDFGYRPAARNIVERLERSLVASCLPRELERQDAEGNVPCLVLAMLPDPGPDTECARFGLEPPSADILRQVRDGLRADEGEESTKHPICQIPQIAVPKGEVCKDAREDIAFCYVEAPNVTKCAHALTFTKASEKLTGARFTMQCIQQHTSE